MNRGFICIVAFYNAPKKPVTKESREMMIPATSEMMHHFFASSDLSIAPSLSPCAQSLSTLLAFTIATIPNGQQQKIVARIDHTR